MIAGIFVKNFKIYSNNNFIPFIESPEEKVTILIGENGAGKSSLIEAVNCFMKKTPAVDWDITVDKIGKTHPNRNGAFIGVVFLIEKTEFLGAEVLCLDHISNAFWNQDFHNTFHFDFVKDFVDWRKKLLDKNINKNYYLLVLGRSYDDEIKLSSFAHTHIMQQNKRYGLSKDKVNSLYEKMLHHYGYVYVPVENKVSDVLKLQTLELQELMNKKIVDEMSSIFEEKTIEGSLSIVNIINNRLDAYVSEINLELNNGYKFDSLSDDIDKIKTVDIISLVFKEYFSRKALKKDGKNVKSLSSGQQRLALIDVITTILSKNHSRESQICLALDEPESSLDNSNRLNQFTKLFDLAEKSNHQIIITTHWYGLLLRPVNGRLIFIDNSNLEEVVGNLSDESLVAKNGDHAFRSFSLLNLYDQRRFFPDSVEMKSYFDLMASLWSILRKANNNWIICEGYEDYQYLSCHLMGKVDNLTILPMNGCGNVKKFYEFLKVPFADRGEGDKVKGKVLFLIDSDPNYIKVDNLFQNKNIAFRKILLNQSGDKVELASIANQNARRTTIEDILDVGLFVKCFQDLCDNNDYLKPFSNEFKYNENAKYVDLSEKVSFLDKSGTTYDAVEAAKNAMKEDCNKKYIAEKYVYYFSKKNEEVILPWVNEIIDFFKK